MPEAPRRSRTASRVAGHEPRNMAGFPGACKGRVNAGFIFSPACERAFSCYEQNIYDTARRLPARGEPPLPEPTRDLGD